MRGVFQNGGALAEWNSVLRVFRRMSPCGDMFFRPAGPVCLRRQAAQAICLPHVLPPGRNPRWGPAPGPDFESAGPRRPATGLRFANSIMKSPGTKTAG